VQRGRPAVITWFRVYAATTLLFYGSALVYWLVAESPKMYASQVWPTLLPVVAILGLVFACIFAVAIVVPYKPWGWTMGLVAICLGLSGCMVLAAIPLVIFWRKPETKAAFGHL
jgi:hypothetical protein